MADKPTIQVRIFEERHWISLDDHKADVKRYKDAQEGMQRKINEQSTTIIQLQARIINSVPGGGSKDTLGGTMDAMFEGLFGSKKK